MTKSRAPLPSDAPSPTQPRSPRSKAKFEGRAPLPIDKLLALYRVMVTSRRLDDLEIQLKAQNHAYFQISGAGHEATLAVAACHLRAGADFFFPYYRDRALCLGLGVTPAEMLLQTVGAASCPASGGRQMPNHWGHPSYNIVSEASTTGTQYLSAVGCAEAGRYWRQFDRPAGVSEPRHDEVVYCSSGEGATSEGVFFEALNQACLDKLPVIFHVEDNGYAISTPVAQQTAGGSISRQTAGFANLLRVTFDGCDIEASWEAWREATAYARGGHGPVLLHAKVVRPYSHSLSDDERLYRTEDERRLEAARDPLATLRARLIAHPDAGVGVVEALETDVQKELESARAAALAAAPPNASTIERFVYSPDVDPTSAQFDIAAQAEGSDATMVDLINACLRDEMKQDSRIVIFGEDVADAASDALLDVVKGKGGVFRVTHGLQRAFGSRRVFNSPLAEANIVGRAVGMALRGMKPVVEIQFFDYIWPAMMQIRSEAALMRWRSNNAFHCPMVIRAAYGGYLKGGSVFHSQSGESIFTHIPGLRVVMPATAEDANGLLRTAIRSEDPVLFLEHKHLYRQTYNRAPYPGKNHMIPFGKARLVRAGEHMTLVTYGALVKRSFDAALRAEEAGIDVEILDLRTLSPYDWEAIATSVQKTSRLLLVHEDTRSWGFGAEIAARAADELFEVLDAPVRRLAAKDTFVGYHPDLEAAILPQTSDILREIETLAAY